MSTTPSSAPPPRADVLLVTATETETRGLKQVFEPVLGSSFQYGPHGRSPDFDCHWVGQLNGAAVFHVQCEIGAASVGGAIDTLKDAIATLKPRCIVMVGIAFAMGERGAQRAGDVLVSKHVKDYEFAKLKVDSIDHRGPEVPASKKLLRAARSLEERWNTAANRKVVQVGLVLSGDKVVDNPDEKAKLKHAFPKAIGGEMEGRGLYVAAHECQWILIKAVCDWGDGKKSDRHQFPAAKEAARFVLELLQIGGFAPAWRRRQAEPKRATPPQLLDPAEQTALDQYLSALAIDCQRLSLADYDSGDFKYSTIRLNSIFTDIEISGGFEREMDGRGEYATVAGRRDEMPNMAVSDGPQIGGEGSFAALVETFFAHRDQKSNSLLHRIAQVRRLVLLGEPGSGKSTALNFVAHALAEHRRLGEQAWLERLGGGWPPSGLIPVRLRLRQVAEWLAGPDAQARPDDHILIWRYLEHTLAATRGEQARLVLPLLRRMAEAGQVIVLLDGLDEVPAGPILELVVTAINALAHQLAKQGRLVVTCRVHDYQLQPERHLFRFAEATLLPLSPTYQEQFIRNWYRALEQLGRPIVSAVSDPDQKLIELARTREDLRILAGNPLLLTMMIRVHAHDGRLPEERVRLYEKCIEFLLLTWRSDGVATLQKQLDLPKWSQSDTSALLDLVGHTAHLHDTGALQGAEELGQPVSADLSYSLLREIAQQFFTRRFGVQGAGTRAESFINYIDRAGNGILQVVEQRADGDMTFRFPHRTFQEYLAGRALTNRSLTLSDDTNKQRLDFRIRARRYIDRMPAWRNPILLGAEQLALINTDPYTPLDLVGDLFELQAAGNEQSAERVILAADVLNAIGRERVQGLPEDETAGRWDEAVKLLQTLMVDPDLAAPQRARAGFRLATLGDPRPGVCTLPTGLNDLYWAAPIPAGTYPISYGEVTVHLRSFRIARYPVTNAQYRQFIEAQGYKDQRWWTTQGWQYIQGKNQPSYWDNPTYNGDNQPVVGLSWYEAVAFCRWLHAHRSQGSGWELRLPTEAEWEVAAMWDGAAMRALEEPEGAICQNDKRAGIRRPSPVGLFPEGMSPCGALDMAGNVWEWCSSSYYGDNSHRAGWNTPVEDFGPLDPLLELPVIRGSSYDDMNTRFGWGARTFSHTRGLLGYSYDSEWDDRVGFRVCVCSARLS